MMKVIFFNGKSKSGIHLLAMGEMLGNACYAPNRDGWLILLNEKERRRLLRNNLFFLSGHYQWTPASEQLLRTVRCKMVLIIRDLRDVLTAFYRALEVRSRTAADWQLVFDRYKGHRERIFEDMLLDNFGKGGTAPKHFEPAYFPWINCNFCYVTRFEKLIGSKGGGNDLVQKKELQQICNFIELPQTDEWYRIHGLKLYNPKVNSFVPGGGVGSYKRYFSKKNIETFEKVAGVLHRKMGYK